MSQQPAQVTPGSPAPGRMSPIAASDRIWTIPNVISFARLLGVPLFLYLLLGPQHDVAAVIVLTLGGTTDWVDGYVARRMNSVSRLGELLDPFADRLYILATLIGCTVRDVVPLWLTLLLVGRDLLLACTLPVLRRHGYGPLPVNFLGKAATFNLLAGFPLLLLGEWDGLVGDVSHAFGWAFAIWGTALYWWAGVLYLVQVRDLVRADRLNPHEGVAA